MDYAPFIPALMTRRNAGIFLASALVVGLTVGFSIGYLYGMMAHIRIEIEGS